MPNTLTKNRHLALTNQSHRCYYCGFPMWDDDPAPFISKYGVSPAQAQRVRCTAEHLQARCQGGSNASQNIVAACQFCNQTRHKARTPLDPERYRQRVQQRVAQGKWQPERLRHLLFSNG